MFPINKDFGIDIAALTGVTQDNREVREGYIFAALQGENADGRDYIDDAIKRGASVILSDKSVKLHDGLNAILITDDNPRRAFSHIVSAFYGKQPENILAVGGTNGKTSVAYFVNQLWQCLGENSIYYGTISGHMTTPDSVFLHKMLAKISEEGVTHVALEASSQGLSHYRMDGVRINVAAFTSFSQDHLDYHIDMETYLEAKLRLFSDVLYDDGVAVLNADILEYERLLSICQGRGLRVLSYGENACDVKLVSVSVAGAGQRIEIEVFGKYHALDLPLVGRFQAMNVLCALACLIAQYPDKCDDLIAALAKLDGVPGRLQHVGSIDGLRHAYVDYAHTPDALENVLKAIHPHALGRLICVFGCGGDRDKAKRPLMGGVAARLCDVAIVTDDNPRSENPRDIRKQILVAMMDKNMAITHEIADRRKAIEFAADLLGENDILLVAGKGHEQGQIFDGVTKPFDDVCEVNKILRRV